MTDATSRRDAHSARVILRRIRGRDAAFGAQVDAVVATMGEALTDVLGLLPEQPTQELTDELGRVVTTLRTADSALDQGNERGTAQLLELAQARLARFVARVEEHRRRDQG